MPSTCCKSLRVLLSDSLAKVVKVEEVFTPVALFDASLSELMTPCELRSSPKFATGPPPDSRSFAEIVLQISLLSHAPPHAV